MQLDVVELKMSLRCWDGLESIPEGGNWYCMITKMVYP